MCSFGFLSCVLFTFQRWVGGTLVPLKCHVSDLIPPNSSFVSQPNMSDVPCEYHLRVCTLCFSTLRGFNAPACPRYRTVPIVDMHPRLFFVRLLLQLLHRRIIDPGALTLISTTAWAMAVLFGVPISMRSILEMYFSTTMARDYHSLHSPTCQQRCSNCRK